jgi:ABC-type dipeptide/oligopeptide/nickel transport system ATPase subunit
MLNLVEDSRQQSGLTNLFIVYNLSMVGHISDRVALLSAIPDLEVSDPCWTAQRFPLVRVQQTLTRVKVLRGRSGMMERHLNSISAQ